MVEQPLSGHELNHRFIKHFHRLEILYLSPHIRLNNLKLHMVLCQIVMDRIEEVIMGIYRTITTTRVLVEYWIFTEVFIELDSTVQDNDLLLGHLDHIKTLHLSLIRTKRITQNILKPLLKIHLRRIMQRLIITFQLSNPHV